MLLWFCDWGCFCFLLVCWRWGFTILMTDDLTACGVSDIYPCCCSKRSSIVTCTSIVVVFRVTMFALFFLLILAPESSRNLNCRSNRIHLCRTSGIISNLLPLLCLLQGYAPSQNTCSDCISMDFHDSQGSHTHQPKRRELGAGFLEASAMILHAFVYDANNLS